MTQPLSDDFHEVDRARLARVLDLTGQPFVLADPSGRIARANRAFGDLLGYEPEDLVGLTIAELTVSRDREITQSAMQRLAESGATQRYEKEYLHRDGSAIPVALVTSAERDEDGRVTGSFAFVSDLRDRKRAELALRESEERFRKLYDEAPFGYHVIDTEGVILRVNRTECELLGYRPEEMVGRPVFDFIVEGQREPARWTLRQRVEGVKTIQEVERTFRTRDGRELTLAIDNRLLRDSEGAITGIRGTVQDVTRRKQAEAALVTSERRSRALFEGIEDAVFVHDLEGRILDANPAASRRLGYTREEFLRLNTREIDDPDFSSGFGDRLETQLRLGRLSCEGRHLTKDGRSIPVDINTSIISLEDQTAILAVIRDITERKALDETRRQFADAQTRYAREMEAKARELARSEASYRGLTQSLLDPVVVADALGRITLFNPAAEEAFGHEAAEVLGLGLEAHFDDDETTPGRTYPDAIRAADPAFVGKTIEATGVRASGETFPVEVSTGIIDGGPGGKGGGFERLYVASIRDLTERNRMRAMLLQSEKLASIGLLSAGVAHEINNPLAFIANNLAVLERDLVGILELVAALEAGDASEIARVAEDLDWDYVRGNLPRLLSRTRDGVARVAAIVANLRGLARTGPAQHEEVALTDLIDGALEIIAPRIKKGHIEVVQDRADLPKIACVPSQIGQVLLNLVVNAAQAIEEAHGEVGGTIRIGLASEGGSQVVSVSDNGAGIPPEVIPKLFDPFFTTKPVGEGTGLGLAISHGIVTGHGGRIDVQSRTGQGTTFRIVLPTDRR